MGRTRSILTLVVAMAFMLAGSGGSAHADHPPSDPDPCTGTIGGAYVDHDSYVPTQIPSIREGVIVPIVDPEMGPYYLDVRDVASEYWLFALWLYEETNGTPGLQRGSRPYLNPSPVPEDRDPCVEAVTPDRLLF